MSLIRLLPLLLLIPTVVLAADDDRLFRVAPEQFKEGVLMEKITDAAILNEGLNSVSGLPQFPLRSSTIYLRHKKGPKEYHWFAGRLNPENFKKLHAFSLKENYLKAEDVVSMRFYGSQMSKAFQDEADIYFDKRNIYTSRIPKLFFMSNGQWQMLKECELPSAIAIDTSNADLELTSYTLRMSKFFSDIYPVKAGMYAFGFAAPGHLPYVDAATAAPGEQIVFKPQMPVIAIDSVIDVTTSVTLEAVANTQSLEQTEALYDQFTSEIKNVYALVDTNGFDKNYPELKTAETLNVAEDAEEYVEYAAQYAATRSEALELWKSSKLGLVGQVSEALHRKMDSLQLLPLSGTMVPEKIEPIFENNASFEKQKVTAFRLTFGKERNRFDFVWVGNAVGVIPDTLYAILDAAVSVKAHMSLESNKPVWIYNEDGSLAGRHHYRYNDLKLIVDDEIVYECQGEFKLPPYISEQEEVKEWFGSAEPVAQAEVQLVVDTAAAQPAVADTVAPIVAPAADSAAPVAPAEPVAAVDTVAPVVDSTAKDTLAKDTLVQDTVAKDSVVQDSVVKDTLPVVATADTAAVDTTPVVPTPKPVEENSTITVISKPQSKNAGEEVYGEDDYDVSGRLKKPLPRIVQDMVHGSVALIDSGEFRYKGRVVHMSPFAIQTTEVTQEFYAATMSRIKEADRRKDRSTYVDSLKPVHNISWNDAREFCKAIGGDLPTEAQWEFAGRADNNEGSLWNLDEEPDARLYAVYRENSYKLEKTSPGYGPQRVAGKKPNEWGIYDMSGNVAEWTKDNYFMFSFWVESSNPTGSLMGSHKIYKGGSWKDKEKYLNLADYDDEDPRYWSDAIGFRCAFPHSAFEGK